MAHVTPEVKRRSRAEQQEATRDALLRAAMGLVVERGMEATSIEEVTRRAGYTRGAFYSNFDSKDDLLLETTRLFLVELHAAARAADDGVSRSGDAAAKRMQGMRGLLADSASIFLAELGLYAVRHPHLLDEVGEIHRQQLDGAIGFAETLLERAGIAPGAIDTRTMANIVQCLNFGLHLFEMMDPEVEAESSAATAMDLMIRGLAAGPAPGAASDREDSGDAPRTSRRPARGRARSHRGRG